MYTYIKTLHSKTYNVNLLFASLMVLHYITITYVSRFWAQSAIARSLEFAETYRNLFFKTSSRFFTKGDIVTSCHIQHIQYITQIWRILEAQESSANLKQCHVQQNYDALTAPELGRCPRGRGRWHSTRTNFVRRLRQRWGLKVSRLFSGFLVFGERKLRKRIWVSGFQNLLGIHWCWMF